MKKIVVTIILILPLLLIYFISFTGKIFSIYQHINVERVVVLNEENKEYNSGDYIKLEPGEEYPLKIKVYPELASDKSITISNSNKTVCEVSDDYVVKTLKNGLSKLIITSVDRHFVQFVININVSQDDIQDFVLSKTSVEVMVGKSEKVDVTILPETTLIENRELVWESLNPEIAKVSNDGLITGVSFGTTTIKVRSVKKPELVKEIDVNVTLVYGNGVYFANPEPDRVFEVNSTEFDLKTITIINLDGVTINDVWYSVGSGYDATAIDVSRLDEGIIKFNQPKKLIKILVRAYINEVEYKDEITIWYVQ